MDRASKLQKLAFIGKLLTKAVGLAKNNKLFTAGAIGTGILGGAAAKGEYTNIKDQFRQRQQSLQGPPPTLAGNND